MKLINCKKCGQLFSKRLRNICDKCLQVENENIQKIYEFMNTCKEHNVSIETISQNTGISIDGIDELFKNGRFNSSISNRIIIKCKICGIEAKSSNRKGHFCLKCIEQTLGPDYESRKPLEDLDKIEITLRKFPKEVMHKKIVYSEEERMKFGFKKSFD